MDEKQTVAQRRTRDFSYDREEESAPAQRACVVPRCPDQEGVVSERIQYFTSYEGGDQSQPYRVDYHGLFSQGFYTRYRGDEASHLFRYRKSEKGRAYERLNEEGTWVHSEMIRRYIWRGSPETLEEIDQQEAKRIAALLGFPEVI